MKRLKVTELTFLIILTNHMTINLYMFGSFMEDRVFSDVDNGFVVIKYQGRNNMGI